MNKRKAISINMVATKSKNKVVPCSTPEHLPDSSSRDSDSVCDSEAASPVPFLCTQDGAEGETDVVWNFYTPKSEHTGHQRTKNSTPLSRKTKKTIRLKLIEEQLPRRRPPRLPQKKTELFQELLELNQKLPELLAKCATKSCPSGSEEDVFKDSPEFSPKTHTQKNSSRCLRKNVLSSKFSKPENETALESDDSMNECLLQASQIVEEKFVDCRPASPERVCFESKGSHTIKTNADFKIDQDSMDAILNSIKLESPAISKVKCFDSPKLGNDSFDSFVGNLNDSALEQLTQMPIKNEMSSKKTKHKFKETSDWTLKDLVVHESSPTTKSIFGRHSSMPESPSIVKTNKPSTSGMVFGRYSSMPYDNNNTVLGDSPIRCTPEEIKRKHKQAREKLLAKRQLPFTSSQKSTQSLPERPIPQTKNAKFQPRIPTTAYNNTQSNGNCMSQQVTNKTLDIKLLIEKKRQEALMKLRRRQPK